MIRMETKVNWKDIGLKIGLEIHQELSGTKLFCSCSTDFQEKNKIVGFTRKIKPSEGEIGGTDVASLYEEQKNQEFIYYGYENEFCLVDTDDEPPHEVNKAALKTALGVALLLKLKIPDVLCIMRKIISDGSAISGFQRSILVGVGNEESYIKTSDGNVRIKDLYLEEDSAKIIKKESNRAYFSLSRTGIPLIEIGTEPDIHTPQQAKEVAAYIGMVLRSCDGIKRGLGTIRQDLNVSIKGHPRVEIKGFQDLRSIPRVIEYEVNRMLKEVNEGKKIEPHVRKTEADYTTSYLRPMPGSQRLYVETDVPVFRITEHILNEVKIPELATKRALKLEKEYGLSPQLAKEVLNYDVFFVLVEKFNKVEPNFIAKVIVEMPKEVQSRYNLSLDNLKDEHFEDILRKLEKNEINRSSVLEILKEICERGEVNYDKFRPANESKIEKDILDIIKKNKGASFNAVMGEIMKRFRGKIDNKKIVEIVKNNAGR